jgi:hypothetical protein
MNNVYIFERIKNILKEIFEILGQWTGILANKINLFTELINAFMIGYQNSISNASMLYLMEKLNSY